MPCLASLSQNSANISKDEDEHLVGLKDIDFANNGIVKGRGINDDRNSDEEFFFNNLQYLMTNHSQTHPLRFPN